MHKRIIAGFLAAVMTLTSTVTMNITAGADERLLSDGDSMAPQSTVNVEPINSFGKLLTDNENEGFVRQSSDTG